MSGLTTLARAVAVMAVVLALTGIAHAACLSDDVVAKLVAEPNAFYSLETSR